MGIGAARLIDDVQVQRPADELADATEQARPVQPLRERAPGLDPPGAYAVQRAPVRLWTDTGDRAVGHAAGLVSAATRQQLGSVAVAAEVVGDLWTVGRALRRNGEVTATGAGAAVLGDPVLAPIRLAGRLAGQRDPRRAGQIVLPGAVPASARLAGATW